VLSLSAAAAAAAAAAIWQHKHIDIGDIWWRIFAVFDVLAHLTSFAHFYHHHHPRISSRRKS